MRVAWNDRIQIIFRLIDQGVETYWVSAISARDPNNDDNWDTA